MDRFRPAAALLVVSALALSACGERTPQRNDTSVMGGSAPAAERQGPPPLTDASGRTIPRPDLPAGVQPQLARTGDESALALWVQDGDVFTAAYAQGRWSAPAPLEQIFGDATDPQLAANERGEAMALWRHTVGSIQSLRYSRFDAASGWSPPDVVPGALPRPHAARPGSDQDAPQLHMDAQGTATARWPSGFEADRVQVARHEPGSGWSRALSEPLASAPSGSPAPPAPSSAR